MSSIPEDQLIWQKEASLILGFKTNQQVSKYIKEGILTKFEKPGSKLIWVSKKTGTWTTQTSPRSTTRGCLQNS